MRFLTEEDLRLLYRNSPFAEYRIEPGTRLTPGGRQFLNDRGAVSYTHLWDHGGQRLPRGAV